MKKKQSTAETGKYVLPNRIQKAFFISFFLINIVIFCDTSLAVKLEKLVAGTLRDSEQSLRENFVKIHSSMVEESNVYDSETNRMSSIVSGLVSVANRHADGTHAGYCTNYAYIARNMIGSRKKIEVPGLPSSMVNTIQIEKSINHITIQRQVTDMLGSFSSQVAKELENSQALQSFSSHASSMVSCHQNSTNSSDGRRLLQQLGSFTQQRNSRYQALNTLIQQFHVIASSALGNIKKTGKKALQLWQLQWSLDEPTVKFRATDVNTMMERAAFSTLVSLGFVEDCLFTEAKKDHTSNFSFSQSTLENNLSNVKRQSLKILEKE